MKLKASLHALFVNVRSKMKLTKEQEKEVTLAKKELASKQAHQAVKRLAALDDQVDDKQLRYLYARALIADQQYTKAWRLVENDQDFYIADKERQSFYLRLILHNQLFITARLFATKVGSQAMIAMITHAEQEARLTEAATIRAREKNFYHLGDRPLRGQQERFEEAAKLPLANYIKAAQFVIRDPYVHPLLRSSVIQDLANLQVDQEMTFYWIDEQEYRVNPGKLKALDKIPVVVSIIDRIQDKYGQDDPLSYQSFIQQFHLQLILLYPRIEETIVDEDAWFDVLTSYSHTGNTDPIKNAYAWQSKLMKIIQKLM